MKKHIKLIASVLNRYLFLLVFLIGAILLILVAWQLRTIANPGVDQDYLKEQQQQLPLRQISIDEQLIDAINALSDPKVNVTPRNLGTRDPFNP